MQKLAVNSIATITMPGRTNRNGALRCFVKSYNKDERNYLVICLNYSAGKSLSIREKAIIEVVSVKATNPDLSKWKFEDLASYLLHEANVIDYATASARRETRLGFTPWEAYKEMLTLFRRSYTVSRLDALLELRRLYFTGRAVPSHGNKKSRTVMRRLRSKDKMRNSNDSMNRRKQRTSYITPSDALRSANVRHNGVSTKTSGKKRKKKLDTPKSIGGINLTFAPSYGFGSPVPAEIDEITFILDEMSGAIAKKKVKKKKKLELPDIPF
jgi:hypothetical protein